MPELKEVYDMVTKQTEPDLSSWNDQERRQRRTGRNRRIGAFALVAAILALAATIAITLPRDDRSSTGVGTDTRPAVPSGPYFLNLTTGAATPLPDSLPEASLYAVSPDGTKIAGAPCCDPPNPVWVAHMDGTVVRDLTREIGLDGFAPRWSPDGATIVYQQRDASTGEIGNIVLVDVVTTTQTTITDLPRRSYASWSLLPSFSADGRSVFFRMPRGPSGDVDPVGWDLVSVPAAGGELTVLRRGASLGASSPVDGSLVYVDPETWTLFLADADGQNPRVLLEVGEEIDRVLWSPTGSEVAYADSAGIHIVDVATSALSLFTGGQPVDWSW
jgi:Tol biopolymer transport system component